MDRQPVRLSVQECAESHHKCQVLFRGSEAPGAALRSEPRNNQKLLQRRRSSFFCLPAPGVVLCKTPALIHWHESSRVLVLQTPFPSLCCCLCPLVPAVDPVGRCRQRSYRVWRSCVVRCLSERLTCMQRGRLLQTTIAMQQHSKWVRRSVVSCRDVSCVQSCLGGDVCPRIKSSRSNATTSAQVAASDSPSSLADGDRGFASGEALRFEIKTTFRRYCIIHLCPPAHQNQPPSPPRSEAHSSLQVAPFTHKICPLKLVELRTCPWNAEFRCREV